MSESPTSMSPKRPGALAGIDPIEFLLAGIAACGAGFFSNPLEVVKTRMQLQGELKARGQYAVHYRNVFHAFYTVAKADGFIAIQKGLVPALWYQFLMNGFRLGTYQIINNLGLTKDSRGELSLPRSVLAGAVSGSMGAFVGSPIYMVKTHLQSKAVKEIAVGHQHSHQSMIQGLLQIHSNFGILGLWRGVSAAIPRVMVGSASQLSTFTISKNYIEKTEIFSHGSWLNSFSAAMVSGVAVTVFMTPFDVVSTRMYNQGTDAQGRGLYYSGFLDCFTKIFRTEGVWGFYKGWAASFFRLGPHTILSLVFWNEGRKLYFKLQNKANEKSPVDTR